MGAAEILPRKEERMDILGSHQPGIKQETGPAAFFHVPQALFSVQTTQCIREMFVHLMAQK